MAGQPSLTIEKLAELGADKPARLVLDEAERNAGVRQRRFHMPADPGLEATFSY